MKIVNNVPWITDREIDLLKNNVDLPFHLGEYSSLVDILVKLDVDVVLEPGIVETTTDDRLKDILNHWVREVERLGKRIEKLPALEEKYANAKRNVEELEEVINSETRHFKRGNYNTKEKVITLYPDEMKREFGGQRLDELLVSTLAHETMHAYFGRKGLGVYPFVLYVEEPLAEFGMLLFLHDVGSSYYSWAYNDVKGKKSCYRYGAMLMDQHLKESPIKHTKRYLERYPIGLTPYDMPTVNRANGAIRLPMRDWLSPSITIGEHRIHPQWEQVFRFPPQYYFDESSGTLCLDGYWGVTRIEKGDVVIDGKMGLYSQSVNNVYLGPRFYTDDVSRVYPIRLCPVYVSPRNPFFAEINNIPVYKHDNKPFLRSCGKGLYDICRNGKWGVIDEDFNQVIPCKYDGVATFSRYGLIGVSNRLEDGRFLYGLADRQGVERVPVMYDSVKRTPKGIWIFEKDGIEYTFDKFGNPIK